MPDEGGDPACWLERVCERCGALVTGPHRCSAAAHLDAVDTGGADGVLWTLPGDADLNANLVRLSPGASIPDHRNDEVDVVVVVLDGHGELTVDRVATPLAPHDLALIPSGATRAIRAGAGGLRYLTVHRARGPLAIRAPSRG